MDAPEFIQVKVISTPEIIKELENDWSTQSEQIRITTTGPENDPTSYQLGLIEVASIVAIIQGAFYIGELGAKLFRWLKEDSSKNKRIIVQTPLDREEFVSRDDLTESAINAALKRLAGLDQ